MPRGLVACDSGAHLYQNKQINDTRNPPHLTGKAHQIPVARTDRDSRRPPNSSLTQNPRSNRDHESANHAILGKSPRLSEQRWTGH